MDQFILEWIAGYCTGRINAEEAGKLREWIDKASENRELFEQYLKTVKINRMVEGADGEESRVFTAVCLSGLRLSLFLLVWGWLFGGETN